MTVDQTEQELRDPFESGGGGARAISWPNVPKGTTIKGVILPTDDGALKGHPAYVVRPQTDIDTGEKLRWDDGQIRPQTEITLQTEVRAFEYISDSALERIEQRRQVGEEIEDDGVRRFISKGAVFPRLLKDALTSAGIGRPEVGGTLAITFKGMRPNPKGTGKIHVAEINYERPTSESKQVVIDYQNRTAKDEDGGFSGPPATGVDNAEPDF